MLVPNADVAGWDGAFLAGSLGAEAGEAGGRITFVGGPATLTRHEGEHGFPAAEMAALHDDGVRLGWLSDRLHECMKRHAPAARAVLLPPWLGARGERATVLSARLGVRVGEIVSGVPGSAGTRFRAKRDAAFERAGVTVVRGRVTAVAFDAKDAGPIRVDLEDGIRLVCDAVVLATGGVLGGGLRYFPSDATETGTVPKEARAPFEATIEAPVRVGWGGDAVPSPSSLFGTPPEELFASRWDDTEAPADRVGVLTGPSGRANADHGIFAVGDLVSDAARTVLDAVVSGVDAGRAAAAGHGFRS
ncbi:MAG: hypothetical protein U0169_25225 [Polyangiaceae bacterium]